MKIEKLTGLVAAPHTPFDRKGKVAYDLIAKQSEHLIQSGVTGAYISGTTGEGVSCSVAERIGVMEHWMAASKGRLKIIVHTGALSIADVKVLAAHANRLGVHATSVVPANYFKIPDVKALVAFCREAAKAAPDCPFYYYHTMLSGITLSMTDFLALADREIPNLAGIKFNSHDLYQYQNCLNFMEQKYDIVFGVDEFYAGALALGAKGFIGSTYNYAAALYQKITRDFYAGDHPAVLAGMKKVCQSIEPLVQYGGIAAGKAMMRIHNLDLGDVRLPLTSLDEAVKTRIAQMLQTILQS